MIAEYYLWIKWLHILAVISWMAGLLYLPRLFVYHVETSSAEVKTEYEAAEVKLLKRIMNPAMIVTWISGFLLIIAIVGPGESWIWVKLALVAAMTFFHILCGKWRKQLIAGTCEKTGKQFRFMNEVPTVLMIAIVGLVVFKPF
jgi:putative membrane protein